MNIKTDNFSRCLNPLTIRREVGGHYELTEDYERVYVGSRLVAQQVPCGRCLACQLDKADSWSMRIAEEVANSPYVIFATYHYSNRFVPKLKIVPDKVGSYTFTSENDENRRIAFDSHGRSICKKREDNLSVSGFRHDFSFGIKNYHSPDYITYVSKRDFQLYFKSLRKLINERFSNLTKKERSLRYYLVTEYGPTTYRAHAHVLFFLQNAAVKEYLAKEGLYSRWQMCDYNLFQRHLSFADSGVSSYVSSYLIKYANIPDVYKSDEFRTFRLSSKSPSIGYIGEHREEIQELILRGSLLQNRKVSTADQPALLVAPSDYCATLFPKCKGFSTLSFERLCVVYGKLWRYVYVYGYSYELSARYLSKKLSPSDWLATRKCFLWVLSKGFGTFDYANVFTYVFIVERYYYLKAMRSLKAWYQWQEEMLQKKKYLTVLYSYSNILDFYRKDDWNDWYLDMFLSPFGLSSDSDLHSVLSVDSDSSRVMFEKELAHEIEERYKMPKFYDSNGANTQNL